MIRPFTCLCMLLAGGSGLYLYQEKHRTSLLDREITRTIHASEAAHERTGLLRAEWALLNEPGRLQDLADRFLALHAMSPLQFVPASELASRLPAPVAPSAPGATDLDAAVMADARPAPAQAVDPAAGHADPGRPATPRAGLALAAASGEATRAEPAPRPVAAAASRTTLAAASADARGAGVPAVAPHPARVAQVEARQDRHPEAVAMAMPVAAAPARSYAGTGSGLAGGQAGGRAVPPVMAPVLSALATPVAHPQHAEPLLTQASATMPVRPSYVSSALPARAFSGSLLGGGRASLPPPVPMGAGAQ